MSIGPSGFTEAGISTNNLDDWAEILTSIGGYRELWRGPSHDSNKQLWGIDTATTVMECLMGSPAAETGYLRLFQFSGVEQQEIRRDTKSQDSGGIFDLDIRVPAVMSYVEPLHALGWKDFSPQVDWPFEDLLVREWLAIGPDAVVLALIQRLAPPLEGFDGLASFSQVFNSSQIVSDIDRALDFYAKLGFEKVLHHEGPLGGRGGEVLGLSPSEAPGTSIDLAILHPEGTMSGSVELVAFREKTGTDVSNRGLPYNLGLNLLRFPVRDLRAYAAQLADNGLRLASGEIVPGWLEPFGETEFFAVQTPDGAWLEFYQAIQP